MRRRSFFVLPLAAVSWTGCARRRRPSPPKPVRAGHTEAGTASWYGNPYHGRRAANGETYDMEKMTAAHRTLPFGTWVRVENLANGKSAVVRITDRGPFVKGRIIDLSRAAARTIGMLGPGTTKVRLVVTEPPAVPSSAEVFAVQVGAFRDKNRAEKLRGEMESQYGFALLVRRDASPEMWRVLVGRESNPEDAESLAARLRVSADSAFVVRLDPTQP